MRRRCWRTSRADPLVTFDLKDVALFMGASGSRGTLPSAATIICAAGAVDVAKRRWLPYHVEPGTDWWEPFHGKTNAERPTGALCDGCHSVNYDVKTKQVTEWNVGCERCHGPGSVHAAHPTRKNVVNPDTLDYVCGNDTCIQCHSQGPPLEQTGFNTPGGRGSTGRWGTRRERGWRMCGRSKS